MMAIIRASTNAIITIDEAQRIGPGIPDRRIDLADSRRQRQALYGDRHLRTMLGIDIRKLLLRIECLPRLTQISPHRLSPA